MNLSAKIEAVLFFKNEPLSIKKLAEILGVGEQEVKDGLNEFEKFLEENNRGVSLMFNDGEVALGTRKDVSFIIERLIKDELHKELGKAGLETLSIILYMGPISKGEIEFIRGVSSAFIIRNLLVRGLVSRVDNPIDKRSFLYKPTFELLSYLGVGRVEELPEYDDMLKQLRNRKEVSTVSENENSSEKK